MAAYNPNRLQTLDGLRGLASIAVVLNHVVMPFSGLTNNPFELAFVGKLFMAFFGVLGSHAVWLFFIMSGFVLAGASAN